MGGYHGTTEDAVQWVGKLRRTLSNGRVNYGGRGPMGGYHGTTEDAVQWVGKLRRTRPNGWVPRHYGGRCPMGG